MFQKIVFILIFIFLIPFINHASASVYTSKTSRIYHSRNCTKLNTNELIEFHSSQEADEAGGIPCKFCNISSVVEVDTLETKKRSTKQLNKTRKPRTTTKWVGRKPLFDIEVNGRKVKNMELNNLEDKFKSKWREYLYDLNNKDKNKKNFLADDYMNKAQKLGEQGKYLEAAAMCEKSVQAEKASQGPRMESLVNELNMAGYFYCLVDQYAKALKYYEEGLAIARKLGREADVVGCYYGIGGVYISWGQYDMALKYYEKALNIFRKLGQEIYVADCHYNIGAVYSFWGQYAVALKNYDDALAIVRKLGREDQIAIHLNSIGTVYLSWGQYAKAIKYYEEALTISRKLGQEDQVAARLNNIGCIYISWGLHDMALKYYEDALTIARKLSGQEANVAAYLNNIGEVYISWGQYSKALKYFEEALAITRKLGREDQVANHLNSIGTVYLSWGQYDKALKYYEEALATAIKQGLEAYVADCHNNIGDVYRSWGQYAKAIKYYEEALVIGRRLGREDQVAGVLNGIGIVYYKKKDYQTAIRYFKESVIIKEKLRRTATGSVRRDYLASQLNTYQLSTSAYIRNSDISSAFKTIELSRAKLLTERLTGNKSKVKLPNIKEIQKTLGEDTAILIYANVNLQDVVQIAITSEEITGIETSNKSFVQSSIDKYETMIKLLLENQRGIKIIKKDKKDQLLSDNTETKSGFYNIINYYRSLLINPSLQNGRGLKVITKKSKKIQDINAKELSKELYKLLIKPLDGQIKGKQNLIIIPDDILAFVPFETLIDEDSKYLVENYRITYTQSIGIQELIKARKYEKDRKPLLAFGGAVYNEMSYDVDMIKNDTQLAFLAKNIYSNIRNNRSVSNAYGALSLGSWGNLPGSLNEVKEIKNVISKSIIITGMDVTEENIKELSRNGELSEYKVIHFATHGLVVPEVPDLSAIVLSQFKRKQGREDGYLRMGEIAKLNIKADFVNLSACETGLGKIYGGEGVVGLTQSFLLAGSNSISVSLWQVADESASRFMVTMYDLVQNKEMNYSDAINEVKRMFIKGEFGEEYKAPYYWSAFVYYGSGTLTEEESTLDNKLSVPQQETSLKKVDRYVDEDKGAASSALNNPNNFKLKEVDRPVVNVITKDGVFEKLGQPDSVEQWSVSEIWHYGDSYVEFKNGILIRCYEPRGEGIIKTKLDGL